MKAALAQALCGWERFGKALSGDVSEAMWMGKMGKPRKVMFQKILS